MYAGKTISLIMAADDDGLIGKDNELPWANSEDLRWFKQMTMQKTVIFGRKTFDGMPALPGRTVIVVSRTMAGKGKLYANAAGVAAEVSGSLQDAIAFAPTKEVMIGGGAEIYKAAMPYVDRYLLSHIPGAHEGNVYSPLPLSWDYSTALAAASGKS